VLIDGNDDDEELELDGTLRVGPDDGAGIVVVVEETAGGDDALNGDAVGAGVMAAGGAVCAPTFVVASIATMPATDPWRSQRFGRANVDRLGVIAGDP
jgi:hypothetical protein